MPIIVELKKLPQANREIHLRERERRIKYKGVGCTRAASNNCQ